MIDKDGYRANVGIVIVNATNQVLLAQRIGSAHAWQFPQGGVDSGESPRQAMYRELQEELGLHASEVTYLTETPQWYAYEIPESYRRQGEHPVCVGQRQKWFLLTLAAEESCIRLSASDVLPEFSTWAWRDFFSPIDEVIYFKQAVYRQVLDFFWAYLHNEGT